MKPVTFVQTYRAGDLINALPMMLDASTAGREVRCVVHEQFADILSAVSYVEPIVWHGSMTDVPGAIALAKQQGGDFVITQVDHNPEPVDVPTENFCAESWQRAGMLDKFHELPLVFDCRSEIREAEAVRKHWPKTDKPVLAYNLDGHSSRFPGAGDFERWLIATNDGRFELLNLGAIRLPNLVDQLALIERAALLITIDTATLHLAYAANTPTIALSVERLYSRSEPRRHWIEHLTYADVAIAPGRERIKYLMQHTAPASLMGRLVRNPCDMLLSPIYHVVDTYEPRDDETKRRFAVARHSWATLTGADKGWTLVEHKLRSDHRSSADLGDKRRLPYVRDVIDAGAATATDNDIVVLTNADGVLAPETATAVRRALKRSRACYSARVDFPRLRAPVHREELAKHSAYVGTDLFAFTAGWWRENRERFPDMLLACEGWDFVLARMIDEEDEEARIAPPVVAHEIHRAFWAVNLQGDPGNDLNRRLGREWAHANGYERYLHAGPWLFKVADSGEFKVASGAATGCAVAESSFADVIAQHFFKHQPTRILETGTCEGDGTTATILAAITGSDVQDFEFVTIEVNPENHAKAVANLKGMPVRCLCGLSMPRSYLPGIGDIHREFVVETPAARIYADHAPDERAEKYFAETDFPGPDALIQKTLVEWGGRADFVLLDSGGHVGFLEFCHLKKHWKSGGYLMCDDSNHVKHYRTLKYIENDPRFTIVDKSDEKFGWFLAKFTPDVVAG